MKIARISKGGRVSIPAAVRSRWGADQVLIEDRGDTLVLRPLPADPIGAAPTFFPPPVPQQTRSEPGCGRKTRRRWTYHEDTQHGPELEHVGGERTRLSHLRYITRSRAAAASLAENYVGLAEN